MANVSVDIFNFCAKDIFIFNQQSHRGASLPEKEFGQDEKLDERHGVRDRRSQNDPGDGFCHRHEATTKFVQSVNRDVAWMITLGHWFLASLGAFLLFFGGVAFTMAARYSEAMKLRDDTRAVIQKDLNQVVKDVAVNTRVIQTMNDKVCSMEAEIRQLHPRRPAKVD
jgi:hypothetical protein